MRMTNFGAPGKNYVGFGTFNNQQRCWRCCTSLNMLVLSLIPHINLASSEVRELEFMKIAAVVCDDIVQCVGNAGRAVQRRSFAVQQRRGFVESDEPDTTKNYICGV
uniref:Uncharacterized protein n=1 Tax=Romanomermis culicivorax TaxID=13658 RepID=A0A915KTC4_ROMCU